MQRMKGQRGGYCEFYIYIYIYIYIHNVYVYIYIYLIVMCAKVQSTLRHIPKDHRIGQYLTYGLDVQLDWKWQLGRPRRRRKNNIKMEVREVV